MEQPSEKELWEATRLQCRVQDLPQARKNMTYIQFCYLNNKRPDLDGTKLSYLIYKHELNLSI